MLGGLPGLGLLVAACAVGAVCDLCYRRIPNWLTLPALPAACLVAGLDAGWTGLAWAAAGAGLGAALLVGPWRLGWVGAGDVKLLAAVGALGGPLFLFPAFAGGAVVGGLMAAVVAARPHGPAGSVAWHRRPLPYGAALALGALAVTPPFALLVGPLPP